MLVFYVIHNLLFSNNIIYFLKSMVYGLTVEAKFIFSAMNSLNNVVF
jgi:hypothetical protein